MFVHEELLSVIFRLVNFGILVFMCVYLFKRYVLPSIKEQMKSEEEEAQAIKSRHKELRMQEKTVTAFAQEQEKTCCMLKEKVHRWRRVQDDYVLRRAQERERRVRYLNDRVAHQELEFAQQRVLQKALPRAVMHARIALQQTFSSADKKRAYLNEIMSQISKEKA